MSDAFEFGLDDAKVIKNSAVDFFKQSKSGEKTRISIVSFKKYSDRILADKASQKGAPLTDAEKAEFLAKIDKNLADQLSKPVSDLTEVDRLDIKQPRFAFAFTHYRDGLGSIKCQSKWDGNNLIKPEVCCQKLGDADQTVGTIVMAYPVKDGTQVDEELLAAKKYVSFYMWKMSSKKAKNIFSSYTEARGDDRHTIDLIVTLDGDPKYQKQQIVAGSNAVWARGPVNSETRKWVLEQGLYMWKNVAPNLGYDMKMDKMLEKLGQSSGGSLGSGSESDAPKLVSGYDSLIS